MVYLVIIVLIFTAEIFIKDYIEKHQPLCKEKKVMQGKMSITRQYNKGGCLNFLEKQSGLIRWGSFFMLAGVVVYFARILCRKGERGLKLSLSFVIGGALSNICDRLFKGQVTDYLILNVKRLRNVVFNLGDFFIFLGSFLLILRTLFRKEE